MLCCLTQHHKTPRTYSHEYNEKKSVILKVYASHCLVFNHDIVQFYERTLENKIP